MTTPSQPESTRARELEDCLRELYGMIERNELVRNPMNHFARSAVLCGLSAPVPLASLAHVTMRCCIQSDRLSFVGVLKRTQELLEPKP